MTSAWSGVLVFVRLTSHWSRLLASKMIIEGGGTVNLINVYIPGDKDHFHDPACTHLILHVLMWHFPRDLLAGMV